MTQAELGEQEQNRNHNNRKKNEAEKLRKIDEKEQNRYIYASHRHPGSPSCVAAAVAVSFFLRFFSLKYVSPTSLSRIAIEPAVRSGYELAE